MPGIDYRKICWPNPDATCLEGGCSYCMDGVWRSINTIRKYAEESSKTGDGTLANRGIGRTPAMEAFLYGATLPGRVNNNIKWRIKMKIEKYHDFATCDEHLTRFLRGTTDDFKVDDGGDGSVTLVMRITELVLPLTSYQCDCGKPAAWYFTNRGASVKRWLEEHKAND